MIRSFRHKGLELFFRIGSKAGIVAAHANHLRLQLGLLDAATRPANMKTCPDGACIRCMAISTAVGPYGSTRTGA